MQVKELSDYFEVSELTIRRDLEFLEAKGEVTRFFGGAKIKENNALQKFEEKTVIHREEKEAIGEYVAGLVKEKTSVFMNSGTTVLEVLKNLTDKNIVLITNNAFAGRILENSNCDLLCTGGMFNNVTKSYLGEFSTRLIEEIFAEMAIMGVNGISAEYGITTSAFQETTIFSMMLERCRGLKIVVTDGSKVGRVKNYKSADIGRIDMLVTTSAANPDELEKIRNAGVEVVLADEELSK